MKYRIPLSYNPIIAEDLTALLHQYDGLHHDVLITGFEKRLADITQSPYVVALNSGTAAIHLGLKALGVGSGDEVLVSTFTYVASINPILYLNARPIFIDSELETWNMDPELLEKAIQGRIQVGVKPKAILVVHGYGMPAKMKEIMAIASRYEIAVLEDAAEALGSTFDNRPLGTLGDIGIISFNNNKSITTYGGGALLAKDRELARKVLLWCSQSREDKPFYEHKEIGFGYRMSPLNAAYGLVGLEKFESKISKRRAIYEMYYKALRDFSGVNFTPERAGYCSNRWLTTVLFDKTRAQPREIADALAEKSIETRPLWNPMHKQPVFRREKAILSGISEYLFSTGLALPSGDSLTQAHILEVMEVIKNKLENLRN